MRITPDQQRVLSTALGRRFGAQARLWLFGSRTDDCVRGGDCDSPVQTPQSDAARLIESKLERLA